MIYRSVYIEQISSIVSFNSNSSWTILQPLEQSICDKIATRGVPLKQWSIHINRGILTGYNDAFIISTEKKDELIAADPKSAEIIRPILRGRDIKRYGYSFADLWVINAHNGLKNKNIEPIHIEEYPSIKAHLDLFYAKLAKRADKGDTPYNLRNCAYMDDFTKQKIIYPETTQGAYFALDDEGFYVDKTCFFMISNTPEYLVATLSSELFEFAYKHIFSSIELGASAYQYNKHAFVLLPVIAAENITADVMSQLTENVRSLKSEKSPAKRELLSNEVDEIIYSIYGISESEKEYIKLNK